MRRVSQNHNIKPHALAQHLVDTGVLLGPWVTPKDDAQGGGVRRSLIGHASVKVGYEQTTVVWPTRDGRSREARRLQTTWVGGLHPGERPEETPSWVGCAH
jgi:hypothetical protein